MLGQTPRNNYKMSSWHVSRVGVGPIFNINQLVNGSFVYAGAFIRPWLFYTSGKSVFFFFFFFFISGFLLLP